MTKYTKHIIILSILLLAKLTSLAGELAPVTGILRTTTTYTVTVGTITGEMEISTPAPVSAADYNVLDLVTLNFDPNAPQFFATPTAVLTQLKVYRYDVSGTLIGGTFDTVSLVVNSDNRYNKQTLDKSILKGNNAYKVKVVIDAIYENGVLVNDLPSYVYIESEIHITRYYQYFGAAASILGKTELDTDCDGVIADELKINWANVPGAEEYQLEWTFVNDYGFTPSSALAMSALKADFKNNATRISTNGANNEYQITLAYERGYIAFRVRAVGRDYLNPDKYIYGDWSSGSLDIVSLTSFSSPELYYNANEHEVSKNWQYSSTFAEEGKKKEIISYFDGSLHNRQSVTKINSDRNVIVGETIYDFQGRPAINVLPTPINLSCIDTTQSPAIKFYDNYNVNMFGKSYSKLDFDKDLAGQCNTSAPPMNNTIGSSQYYSENNPNKLFQQAYVPDAEKYPFSQVEYTPDNTGRIRSQSGVGPTFQLGNKHETKYLYSQPNQIQLDRLFGSEVGDFAHYKKNTVIDANGQISISYLNQEGKTIATSLAGDPPIDDSTNIVYMEALASESTAAVLFTVDAFGKDANGNSTMNTITSLEDGIEFSTQLSVSYNSTYTFNYDISIDTLADSCLRPGFCISCIYDLEIQVLDECGDSKLTSPINKQIGHLTSTPNGFTMTCSSPTGTTDVEAVTISLTPGVYTVSKILTLNKDARDFYLTNYLDSTYNSCIKTQHDFVSDALANLDTSSCYTSCSTCVTALGTKDDYVAAGRGTDIQYDFLLEQCLAPCKDMTICEASYEMMLLDVTPGGQYAGFNAATGTSSEALSVLNAGIGNYLPANLATGGVGLYGNWKKPMTVLNGQVYNVYLNDLGERVKVNIFPASTPSGWSPEVDNITTMIFTDAFGQNYTYPENLKYLNDFIPQWNEYFARSLVLYHPEYAYYIACKDYSKIMPGHARSTDQVDSLLLASPDYATAVANKFIKPGYLTNYPTIANPNNRIYDWSTFAAPGGHMYDPILLTSSPNPFDNFSGPFATNYLSAPGWLQNPAIASMQFKMQNYLSIGSVTYTMLEAAAIFARCGNNFYATPTADCMNFGVDFIPNPTSIPAISQINDSIRNKEWEHFKNFYIAEKRKLQFNRMDFFTKYFDIPANPAFPSANILGGCNACIGNNSFNPLFFGFYSTMPFSMTSPAYDISQPCSFFTFHNFENAQKRFVNPSNTGLSGSNSAFQIYQQTGQCPMAFQLHGFLNAITQSHNLYPSSSVSLGTISAFNPDLYNAVNGGLAPSSYVNYQWDVVSVVGSVLTATIKDPITSVVKCTITLDITGTAIPNYSSILSLQNLTFDFSTVGADHFKVYASYLNGGGATVNEQISGSSCIKIHDCQFEPQCTPNQFAVDVMNLGNVLKANGFETSINFNMSANPAIDPALSTTIKNTLGTPNSALIWNFVTPDKVEIYDNTNPTTKIVITTISTTIVAPGTVIGYANIRSNYNNLFKMDGVDVSGNVLTNIEGKAEKIVGATITGIQMGSCAMPINPDCSLTEHIVRTDLENLLDEILTVKPFVGSINLYAQPSFTNLLQGYYPSTQVSTTSTYDFDSGALTSYDTLIFTDSGSCEFKLYHNLNHLNSQAVNFGDLISVDHLTGIPPIDANQNMHDFYFIGSYAVGASVVQDTVWGTSCLPIKNCDACEPALPTVKPPLDYDSIIVFSSRGFYDPTLLTYTNYKNKVDTLNILNSWDSTDVNYVPVVDYVTYANKGYYNAEQYVKFVANYDSIVDSTQYLNIDKFIYAYGNLTNCTKEYERYIRATNAYNTRALSSSATLLSAISDTNFYENNLCDTLFAYVKYLGAFPAAGPTPQTIFQYAGIITPVTLTDSCSVLYAQYLDVYSDFLTDTLVLNACKEANQLHPLYSKEVIEENNLCCSMQGLGLFNDYINGLANATTSCPPMLQSIDSCSSTLRSVDVSPRLCNRNYIYFITKLNQYNVSAYAIAHADTLDVNIYPTYYLFQKAGYCDCVIDYINYLNSYISAPGSSTLPLPDDIDHFGGCTHSITPIVEDTCKALYAEYLTAVNSYNAFVLANPGLGYPNIKVIYTNEEFISKYCQCGKQYVANLEAIVNGMNPPAEEVVELIHLPNACQTPCVNTPPDTAFTFPPVPYSQNPCVAQLIAIAVQNALNDYNQYVDSVTTSFVSRYNEHCLHPLENFHYTYTDKEYHFTLYYYDQAGNLVKTIPPEGVSYLPITSDTSPKELEVINDRTNNTKMVFTSHRLATTYEYNSLNQLVRQNMPDHDQMQICENILPNGLDADLVINNVQYVSSNKGYLTGYLTRTIASTPIKRGYVYTTNDAGQNWTRIRGLAGADIQKIQFVSATDGYAVANYGMVLKTLDGGNSWDVLTSLYNGPDKYFGTLNDLYFTSTSTGLVAGTRTGSPGTVYKTINGGATFVGSTGFAANDTVTGLTFDGTNYYASVKNGTAGKIYTSTTGTTWTQQLNIAANMLKKVKYITNTVAYAVGYDGTLLKSNGANTSWEVVPTANPYKFSDIYFKDATNGIAIVDSVVGLGRIYKTLDAGHTWEVLSAPGKYYSSIQMYDASPAKVIASGQNGLVSKVLMTTPPFGMINVNASIASVSDDFTFSDAYLQASSNKLITLGVTNTTKVYFTFDANASSVFWETFTTPYSGGYKKGLVSVTGTTAPTVQAVLLNNGVLYTFYKTSSPALPTYAPVTIAGGGTQYFSDITAEHHNGSGIFYAFDSISKTIYRVSFATSTAPTATATQITGAVTQSINSIAMNNNGSRILLAGNSGTLQLAPAMTTTNTTITWTNSTNALTPVPLNDITVTSATVLNNVIAVGNDGTMWNTTNGGTQWNMVNTNTSVKLNAIKSDVSAIGLVAGNSGQVFAASTLLNTAAMLTTITTTITDNFKDVGIDASNKAYAVTDGGKAIYISNYLAPTAVTALTTNSNGSLNGLAFKPSTTTAYAVGNGTGVINYINASGVILTDVFTHPYYGISFHDNNAGYVVDSGYVIRHTINGGANWTTVLPIPSTPLITKVVSTGINKAIVVGSNNYAAVINNNSSPVAVLVGTAPPTSRYNDISFNQSGQGIIVGTQRVAATIVASGSTYIINNVAPPISAPPNFRFNAVHVFNDGGFIACGTKGKIYYHDASSNTYYQQSLGMTTTDVFNDIYFHDDRVGYVVGNDGKAFKCNLIKNIDTDLAAGTTTDNITWNGLCPLTIYNGLTPTSHNFYAIAFATRTTGFLAGSYSPSVGVFVRHAQVLNDESDLYSTRFWYDKLGRMVISQNTKQFSKVPLAYSYTLYDELGRIKEVGEKSENGTATKMKTIFGTNINGLFNLKAIDDFKLLNWVNDITGARKEVTKTYYDDVVITPLPITQNNLRKRVATVTYEDVFDNVDATYQHATHYSYDIHGNVNVMLQDNPSLASPTLTISQQYKRIDYDYDLISGKVNKVTYQKAERDEFNHRYAYDADNRITKVETSTDGIIWDMDAKYFYYAHGPLARVEYGNNAVQGMDYAYTLQGWIKGVNSNTLDADRDMGKDGSDLIAGHPNKIFAKDAFGYSLNYYQGDYKQINYLVWNDPLKRFEATTFGSQLQANRYDLFNGNISSTVVTIEDIDSTAGGAALAPKVMPLGSAYKYDQLNRIKSSVAFDNITIPTNLWEASGQVVANLYANSFTYDANGNIISQYRSDETGTEFDAMQYKYKRDLSSGDLIQNRLYHVRDNLTYTSLRSEDIDDEGNFNPNLTNININNNYNYDAIGNLTKDSVEQIANIEWTVYGKIKRITRPVTSTKDNLVFDYDASGNRIAKHVYDASNNLKYTTYYVRDAQGNVMSIYDMRIPSLGTVSFKLIEQNLYGSSRIGLNLPDKEMVSTITPRLITHYLGKKQFEMSDHLGNILTTISDRKIPVESTITPGTISYKVADILSNSGYYPFGMKIKSREFVAFDQSRMGYNGKENDREISGDGNNLDFGARMYDSRLGKFLAIDPKATIYPYFSTYGYALNCPIYLVDGNGEGPIPPSFIMWAIKEGIMTKASLHNVYSFEVSFSAQAMVKKGMSYQYTMMGLVADHKGNIGFYFPKVASTINMFTESENVFNSDSKDFKGYGYGIEAELVFKEGFYPGHDNALDLTKPGYSSAASSSIPGKILGAGGSLEFDQNFDFVGYTTSLEIGVGTDVSTSFSKTGLTNLFLTTSSEINTIMSTKDRFIDNNSADDWGVDDYSFNWEIQKNGDLMGVWSGTKSKTINTGTGTYTKTEKVRMETGVIIKHADATGDIIKTSGVK